MSPCYQSMLHRGYLRCASPGNGDHSPWTQPTRRRLVRHYIVNEGLGGGSKEVTAGVEGRRQETGVKFSKSRSFLLLDPCSLTRMALRDPPFSWQLRHLTWCFVTARSRNRRPEIAKTRKDEIAKTLGLGRGGKECQSVISGFRIFAILLPPGAHFPPFRLPRRRRRPLSGRPEHSRARKLGPY